MKKYLVVARYQEPLDWLSHVPKDWNVTVYDKSKQPIPTAIPLRNVGREAETFLRYIVDMWPTIQHDDIIVFVQGNPFDHYPGMKAFLQRGLSNGQVEVIPLGPMLRSDAQGKPHHPGLPIGWAHRMLGLGPVPVSWDFAAGAQYAVSGRNIRAKSHAWWQRIHTTVEREVVCAWTMERLWMRAFS